MIQVFCSHVGLRLPQLENRANKQRLSCVPIKPLVIEVSMAAKRKQEQFSKDWLKDARFWLAKTQNNVTCPLVEDFNGLHRCCKSARHRPEEPPNMMVKSGMACQDVEPDKVFPDGKPIADRESDKDWHFIHVLNTKFHTHGELLAIQALHLELGMASVRRIGPTRKCSEDISVKGRTSRS